MPGCDLIQPTPVPHYLTTLPCNVSFYGRLDFFLALLACYVVFTLEDWDTYLENIYYFEIQKSLGQGSCNLIQPTSVPHYFTTKPCNVSNMAEWISFFLCLLAMLYSHWKLWAYFLKIYTFWKSSMAHRAPGMIFN